MAGLKKPEKHIFDNFYDYIEVRNYLVKEYPHLRKEIINRLESVEFGCNGSFGYLSIENSEDKVDQVLFKEFDEGNNDGIKLWVEW